VSRPRRSTPVRRADAAGDTVARTACARGGPWHVRQTRVPPAPPARGAPAGATANGALPGTTARWRRTSTVCEPPCAPHGRPRPPSQRAACGATARAAGSARCRARPCCAAYNSRSAESVPVRRAGRRWSREPRARRVAGHARQTGVRLATVGTERRTAMTARERFPARRTRRGRLSLALGAAGVPTTRPRARRAPSHVG
jgi:hypothetical protein